MLLARRILRFLNAIVVRVDGLAVAAVDSVDLTTVGALIFLVVRVDPIGDTVIWGLILHIAVTTSLRPDPRARVVSAYSMRYAKLRNLLPAIGTAGWPCCVEFLVALAHAD